MALLLHKGVTHRGDAAVALFEAIPRVTVQGCKTRSHIVNWTGPAGQEIESAVNLATSRSDSHWARGKALKAVAFRTSYL